MPDEERALIADPVLQQRLAKYLVLQCFRNSVLEDFHSGVAPSSVCGDYSDVTVSSPYGTILWPRVSRLNDEEMKRLMIDVAIVFSLLSILCWMILRAVNCCRFSRSATHFRSGTNQCVGERRPGPTRLLEKGRSAERPDRSLPATCMASLACHRRRSTHC